MSEFEFYAYPDENDFADAVARRSFIYEQMGGVLASQVLRDYFFQSFGINRHERAGTAYIAQHIEPLDTTDVPYDAHRGQATAFMKGMEAGYDVMATVQPVVTSMEVIQTLVNGAAACESEYCDGLLTRPVLMDMGLRGLYLVGAEARCGVNDWARQMTAHVEKRLMFQLGVGAVLHIADAVHIQHNMQGNDHYVSSDEWGRDLRAMSQLNTGE